MTKKTEAVTMSDAQELAESLPKPPMTLSAALRLAQSEMTRAKKDKTNPHFRSSYADLSSVQDACMPALLKHGICVLQTPQKDDDGYHIRTTITHSESGESESWNTPMLMNKQDMQGFGSAMTYARRYGLMCVGVAPHDDDGNAASEGEPVQKPKPKKASDDSIKLLLEYVEAMDAFNGSVDVFLAWLRGTKGLEVSEMTEDFVRITLKFFREHPDPKTWKPESQEELKNALEAFKAPV